MEERAEDAVKRTRDGVPHIGRILCALVKNGFDSAYLGTPPWDIGRPQAEIVELEEKGGIRGSVLDCGCGTGENAMYLTGKGHEVWGIDAAPNAIRKAEAKALAIRVRRVIETQEANQ